MAVTLTACGSKELKNTRGLVKAMFIEGDTVKMLKMDIDGKERIVKLDEARFQNGISLKGDSIILDYIDGRDDTLRALVVTVLPKPAQYFEPSDTLITRDSKPVADSIQ